MTIIGTRLRGRWTIVAVAALVALAAGFLVAGFASSTLGLIDMSIICTALAAVVLMVAHRRGSGGSTRWGRPRP